MRRTALLCLPAAVLLAACSTTVAGQASPAQPAAPTSDGPSDADREAVGDLFDGLSASTQDGLEAHAEYMAEHNHPEFSYTAEECLDAFRSAGLTDDYTAEYEADTDAMAPDDGWTLAADAGRYAGLQPSGQVFVLPVDVTQSFGGTTDSYAADLHAAVLDGTFYLFFACDAA
ncbi:hypothetical protein TEK04_15485 [Klenkia sp. LSe6-5]|uniref:Lipoprotein n=1 Tax=Klenkia sesuvii TaxID=3103137 RepID=A0ABU8DWS3_9ACTN